ncbi:unnamed protein product [Lupinus luteus]|uniref:Uncharacterized protein n=1 Tax=Lupinus luteus TaxID=3873 RepID=A0AAV1XBF2_LUPLU
MCRHLVLACASDRAMTLIVLVPLTLCSCHCLVPFVYLVVSLSRAIGLVPVSISLASTCIEFALEFNLFLDSSYLLCFCCFALSETPSALGFGTADPCTSQETPQFDVCVCATLSCLISNASKF